MDSILAELIQKLPESKTKLSKENKERIYRNLPVPREYDILWADISSINRYPCGIVLTNKALVYRATKKEVKHNNALVDERNKGLPKEEREKHIKEIYQIVPWEYYSILGYQVVKEENKDSKSADNRYILLAGDTQLASFSSDALFQLFSEHQRRVEREQKLATDIIENATLGAINTINSSRTYFNVMHGADFSTTGHGIYAEEAGTLLDKFYGEEATRVGGNNAKYGPDKIVNANPVQCKYYKSANDSVNACFARNSDTGAISYKYLDFQGAPMKLEVPKDQYADAIIKMQDKIKNGQVPGVVDPEAAYNIIREGKLTYQQARNLAKAGTIESLQYDVVTGAVTCLSAFGLSTVVSFAQVYWTTKDVKKAAKCAAITGLQVYGLSFVSGVIASQLSRTGASGFFKPAIETIESVLTPKQITALVNATRALAGKGPIYGNAARKSFEKYIGTNALTQCIMLLVFTVPDAYKLINGKMSGQQFAKNLSSLITSYGVSAAVTTFGINKIVKKALPENSKGASTVAFAIVCGVGLIVGTGVKAVGDYYKEDDSLISLRMFNAILSNILLDYLLLEDEQDLLFNRLNEKEKEIKTLNERIIGSSNPEKDIRDFIVPMISDIIAKREKVTLNNEELYDDMMSSISEGELT